MEHFEELKQATLHKQRIEDHIERLPSLGYMDNHGGQSLLGITKGDNGRYTFGTIAKIIGDDRLRGIIEQFEGLLAVELHRAKQEAEKQLARYHITIDSHKP